MDQSKLIMKPDISVPETAGPSTFDASSDSAQEQFEPQGDKISSKHTSDNLYHDRFTNKTATKPFGMVILSRILLLVVHIKIH